MIPYKNIGKHSLLSRYRFFFECMTPWISGPSTTDGARKLRTGQTKILTRESSLRKFWRKIQTLEIWNLSKRVISRTEKSLITKNVLFYDSPRNEFSKSLLWSQDLTNTGITRLNHSCTIKILWFYRSAKIIRIIREIWTHQI